MYATQRITRLAAAALLAGTVAPALAEASGRHPRRAEADIESLDATLRFTGSAWRLRVRYEVEIERPRRHDRFELVLTVVERGRRDYRGRPLTIVLPLDRPTEVDDDALEFEGGVALRIPARSIDRPSRLKLIAEVVQARSGRVLDRERESVDLRRGLRRPRWVRRARAFLPGCRR